MARINTLIDKVKDPQLRQLLLAEVSDIKKQKKFGLVFEEHVPEATPLYELPIVSGCLVSERDKQFVNYYLVERVDGDDVFCVTQDENHDKVTFRKGDIVRVALFGQPIYPSLQPMDEVKNAPNSSLWHTLIEAENYHALQLLVYLYAGKVDCIYIDPPYNTGDKSWKYNNDYVDSSDSYRHSKWLCMMKKRLLLAKKLLNPKDSVLIVTIDEKEYLRLGCLLEELFPDANMQMISSVVNPAGVSRGGEFARTDEYLFLVMLGKMSPTPLPLSNDWRGNIKGGYKDKLRWNGLMRSGTNARREDRPNLFYPIYISTDGLKINGIGDSIPLTGNRKGVQSLNGSATIWPIRSDGSEGNWQISQERLNYLYKRGYVRLGNFTENGMSFSYLKKGEVKKVEDGKFPIAGYRNDGSIVVDESVYEAKYVPGTQWWIKTHDATQLGTKMLNSIIGSGKFDFPKSVYAVHDVLRFFVANNPSALIVDFFAGSGTTLHAVNLLNAEDGGNRRCIMVTNNEVSAEEETKLKRKHLRPGMEEWDKWGIARFVNWPRTKCSILGIDVNGNPLTGSYQTYLKQEKEKDRTIRQITLIDDPSSLKTQQKKELVALTCQGKLPQSLVKADSKYIVSEDHPCSILFDANYAEEWLEALDGMEHITELYIVTRNNGVFKQIKTDVEEILGKIIVEEPVQRPMSEGFEANVKYFKLGFLDKHAVALHRQFRELLPILWMKAGCIGECPVLPGNDIPDALVFTNNKMAILTNEDEYADFRSQLEGRKDIENIFIIAKSANAFLEMAQPFTWAKTYHLYKDYLDNFSINYER